MITIAGQNPQQERGGALLFLCALSDFWTQHGPARKNLNNKHKSDLFQY